MKNAAPDGKQNLFWPIVIAAFVVRAAFLLASGPYPQMGLTPDSTGYTIPAVNMIQHGTFSFSEKEPFEPDTIRTPGYPLFLIPFVAGGQAGLAAAIWAQALLGAFTAGLVYLIAVVLWGRNVGAIAAGFGMAADYVVVLHGAFIMTEAVFVFFFVLGLYGFARYLATPRTSDLILSGLCFGMATVVRPAGIFFFVAPFLILAARLLRERTGRAAAAAALFLVSANLLPAAWCFRNHQVAGTWSFSTIQGVTRAAILVEHLTGLSYEQAIEKLYEDFREENPQPYETPAQETAAATAWSNKFILRHPGAYAQVLAKESFRFFAGNSMKASAWMLFKDPAYDPFTVVVHDPENDQKQVDSLWKRHPSLGAGLVLILGWLGLVYLLSVVGFVASWRVSPEKAWLMLAAAFYFFAICVGMGAHARYRVPAMPGFFLLAGCGLNAIILRRSKSGRLAQR